MKKTLVIYGHPYYKESYSNKAILDKLTELAPEVEIVNLMEKYPDYKIDVEQEQKRLADYDVIIFQFPVWWYGMPSILNRYVEEVFAHGFAYGSKGKALMGKELILSYTVGATEDEYTPSGEQHHTMREFMQPIYSMAELCNLGGPGVIASYGMAYINPNDTEHNNDVTKRAINHAERLYHFFD